MKQNILKNKGQKLKLTTLAFTLIELLAVIVILAIIALIATPIILGTINDSKERATELSVKNYIRAVELAISNKYVKDPTINLDGQCEIVKETNGKKIKCGTNDPIPVEYEGSVLIEGTITLKKGEVTRLNKGKIDEKYVMYNNGKITLFDGISTLVSGEDFNKAIKTLATGTTSSKNTVDTTITSIEFYSNGKLPKGYTKAKLQALSSKVDVSLNSDGSIMAYFDNGKVYVISDNLISFNVNSSGMFYNCQSVENINFSDIDTSDVTNMAYMFAGCKGLTELDVSNFETKGVTNMFSMFASCSSLTELNISDFDTSDVKNMGSLFEKCNSLIKLDVSNFDTSNVTNMAYMFYNCQSLKELNVSNFDTGNVEYMGSMFTNCRLLTNLNVSRFNTEQVTEMQGMFAGCMGLTELNVKNFNTSDVTRMDDMFSNCSSLTSLNLNNFNTEKVTSMVRMFMNCSGLKTLDIRNFDTSKVTTMSSMFDTATKLKTIFVGENWKIPETATNMFNNCATENVEQLCEPNSTEEWCVLPS